MHPEWGGWDAPRRPEACKFIGKKKEKKKKTNGADRGYCPFRNGDRQTDNPPQKQGGIFAGDAGGRELGSAEL